MRTTVLFSLVALLALSACDRPSDAAFYNRGGPDALLDVSSEVVNLSVAGPNELSQLSSWVEQDQPSRAELYCTPGEPRCTEARKVLELHGVPVMQVPSMDYTAALVYERILARDCNPTFRDRTYNNWNLRSPSFGCSISANIVQHVSDKQQFVNPNLTDTPRATGAVAAYGRAYAPKAPAADTGGISIPLINSAKTE